jgi:hypothetical protein
MENKHSEEGMSTLVLLSDPPPGPIFVPCIKICPCKALISDLISSFECLGNYLGRESVELLGTQGQAASALWVTQ